MKLGKDESAESADDSETTSKEETPEPSDKPDESESTEKKEDVDSLRKVIKVDQKEDSTTEEKKEESPAPEKKDDEPTEEPKEKTEKTETEAKDDEKPAEAPAKTETAAEPASPDATREDLEQKRNMLQNMKDFDFQIKKNQEDISNISEKIDALTKDLDDLVSLYEIVSEQMNPFVGLSKVTKKRIDALENFTQEIEDVKARMGDVESTLEKGIGGIQRMAKKFDGKEPAPSSGQKIENELSELEEPSDETEGEPGGTAEEPGFEPEKTAGETATEPEPEVEQPSATTEITPSEIVGETKVQTEEVSSEPASQFVAGNLPDDDLDKILSESLESLIAEQNIENMINEFLLSLK